MKSVILIVLFSLSSVFVFGQKDKCQCCSIAHQQFDFWVGKWNVFDDKGKKVGENEIAKEVGGCVLQEQWVGIDGFKGTSINYWDGTDSTWNQLWVDQSGLQLKLKGTFIGDKMSLLSDPSSSNTGEITYNKITWTTQTNGDVQQLWEILNGKAEVIQVAFLGIYKRKNESLPKIKE